MIFQHHNQDQYSYDILQLARQKSPTSLILTLLASGLRSPKYHYVIGQILENNLQQNIYTQIDFNTCSNFAGHSMELSCLGTHYQQVLEGLLITAFISGIEDVSIILPDHSLDIAYNLQDEVNHLVEQGLLNKPDSIDISCLSASCLAGILAPSTLSLDSQTMLAVSYIIKNGADNFRKLGTVKDPGSKLVRITGSHPGIVDRPGVYEVQYGTSLSDIISLASIKPPFNYIHTHGLSGQIISSANFYSKKLEAKDDIYDIVVLRGGERYVLDYALTWLQYLQKNHRCAHPHCNTSLDHVVDILQAPHFTHQHLMDLSTFHHLLVNEKYCSSLAPMLIDWLRSICHIFNLNTNPTIQLKSHSKVY